MTERTSWLTDNRDPGSAGKDRMYHNVMVLSEQYAFCAILCYHKLCTAFWITTKLEHC